MESVVIDGYEIQFPFAPYAAQVTYMTHVLAALRGRSHALLESPTGTGKTLCLLSATLAWLERERANTHSGPQLTCMTASLSPLPVGKNGGVVRQRVIYCSRTHAQLSQVIREFKRTPYAASFKMAILGSREHMCVNNDVKRLGTSHAQNALCNNLRREHSCRFFNKLQRKDFTREAEEEVCDMEDLVREGRRAVFCPYFHQRDACEEADIIFMPYNYVLSERLRKQLPFDPAGAVLIVDEAHNLPSLLSADGCHDLAPLDLAAAIQDCSKAIAAKRMQLAEGDNVGGGGGGAHTDGGEMMEQELASLKLLLHGLEKGIRQADLTCAGEGASASGGGGDGRELVRPGPYMLEFLAQHLITRELYYGNSATRGVAEVISKAIELLSEVDAPPQGLSRLLSFLAVVFGSSVEAAGDGGDEPDSEACPSRFVLRETSSGGGEHGMRTLGFWQLDNSGELQGLASSLRCMIMTSGTLAPLEHFEADLGVRCPVQLRGSHVITPEQVLGCVVRAGPGRERLNGSYGQRDSPAYRRGVGMCLVNLARNVPGGVLVFFSSYTVMNGCILAWKAGTLESAGDSGGGTQTIWGMLNEKKTVFVEPKSSADLGTIVAEFQAAVDRRPSVGAMLFAVTRGKVSEGVDFADHHGRCVVLVGIPFANHADLFVRLKKAYLTRVAPRRPLVHGRPYTGDVWYRHEAMRAANQCVGRVIRHRDDYGCAVFADERYAELTPALSDWIAARTHTYADFSSFFGEVTRFFARFAPAGGGELPAGPALSVPTAAAQAAAESAAVVPASAEAAKRFAERAEQAEEERRLRVRRKLENGGFVTSLEVFNAENEDRAETSVPTAAAPLLMPKQELKPPPPFTKGSAADMDSPGGAQPSREQSQSHKAEEPELVGSSSKEFCAFLKRHVSAEDYGAFRKSLTRIAALAARPPNWQESFTVHAQNILDIFSTVAGYTATLRSEFARHLPASFLALYTQVSGVSRIS